MNLTEMEKYTKKLINKNDNVVLTINFEKNIKQITDNKTQKQIC